MTERPCTIERPPEKNLPAARSAPRAYVAAFLVVLVLAACVRFWLMAQAIAVGRDAARHYLPLAQAVSRMQFSEGFDRGIPPLYPVLGGLTAMVAGDVEVACRLVSLLAGVSAVLLVGLLAYRIFGPWPALLAAALLAFHPYHCRFSAEVGPDALAVALLLGVTLAAVSYAIAPSFWRAAVVGALLACLSLTRPEGAFYVPPVLLLMILLPARGSVVRRSRLVLHIAVLVAVALLLCLPRLVWVHQQTGQWVVDTRQISWPLRVWSSLVDGSLLRYSQLGLWRRAGLPAIGDSVEAFGAAFGPAALLLGLYAILRGSWTRRRLQWAPALLIVTGLLVFLLGSKLTKRYLLSSAALWQIWGGAGLALLVYAIRTRVRAIRPSRARAVLPYLLAVAVPLLQLPWAMVHLKESRRAEKLTGEWILQNLGAGQRIISRDAISAWYARSTHIDFPSIRRPKRCYSTLIQYARKQNADLLVLDDAHEYHCPQLISEIKERAPTLGQVVHQLQDGTRTLTVLRLTPPCEP